MERLSHQMSCRLPISISSLTRRLMGPGPSGVQAEQSIVSRSDAKQVHAFGHRRYSGLSGRFLLSPSERLGSHSVQAFVIYCFVFPIPVGCM